MFLFEMKKCFLLMILYSVQSMYIQNRLSSQEIGNFSEHERECINKLHANQTMITESLKELYLPDNLPEFNAFMACTWEKDGLLEAGGEISLNGFKYYVKGAYSDAVGIPELAEFFANDSVERCKNVDGDTPGQKGVRLMNCILRTLYTVQ